jgi:two-component system response regulator NreC
LKEKSVTDDLRKRTREFALRAVTKLRIFLADDHAVVRAGLKALVDAQAGMEVVGEAADGQATVDAATALQPDVVVMDVSMPGLSGAKATERLKQTCPSVHVLALTAHEDRSYLRQLLAAGALGYVLKRSAAEELVRAIRTVAAGGVYVDPSLAGQVVGAFVAKQGANEILQGADLSDREEEVVRLIAQGYSNKEIAARLSLSVKTVETYKSRSMQKLGLRGRTDLVRYALQRGWLRKDEG